MDGVPLHLQIITPQTRNTIDSDTLHPCLVYVQGSAWLEQNINAKLGILSRLAEKGYVIAVVEYRHSGTGHKKRDPLYEDPCGRV